MVSVRESDRSDLPSRGLSLITSTTSLTMCMVVPGHFPPWYRTLGQAAAARNALLYRASMVMTRHGFDTDYKAIDMADAQLMLPNEMVDITMMTPITLFILSILGKSKDYNYIKAMGKEDATSLAELQQMGVTVGCTVSPYTGGSHGSQSFQLVLCQSSEVVAKTSTSSPPHSGIRGTKLPKKKE